MQQPARTTKESNSLQSAKNQTPKRFKMRRFAADVITKLLDEKQKMVTTFPPSVLMPKAPGPEYEDQCLLFLQKQIEIVEPRIVIALGGEANKRIKRINMSIEWQQVMHPSAREFKRLITRKDRILAQGQAIRNFLINASAGAKQLDT